MVDGFADSGLDINGLDVSVVRSNAIMRSLLLSVLGAMGRLYQTLCRAWGVHRAEQ
jgi:hypothetical protein